MADQAVKLGADDNEDEPLSPALVRDILAALDQGNQTRIHELVDDLRPADLAELLDLVRQDERRALIEVLGERLDAEVLSELDEGVRDDVIELLEPQALAAALQEMDSDDAVYFLEDMPQKDQREILRQMPESDRAAIEQSLEYPEDSAGRLMQRDLVAVPPFWDVGQTIDHMREASELPDAFYEIFVVDPAFRPIGSVPLSRLLRTKRPVRIWEIMETEQTLIQATTDREEVAYKFNKYDLISAAVTDESGRLVGVITVDDIVEVISEEASEDIGLLGGVGDETISDTVMTATRSRFSWLFVNLLTAILASLVISLFDATIGQMVALAVLMPIVASMGGNAGTQTMTIAVRALASKDLVPLNARRIITREVTIGFLNGVMFALIMGAIAGLWFESAALAAVVATSMVINLVVAGLAGIVIPLTLDRMKIDPAIASGVFLTTVTDVIGFFAFLGLATLVFFN